MLICALDNMTRIHGKVHPMIAVLSIGDCELLLLRRKSVIARAESSTSVSSSSAFYGGAGDNVYEKVFHTEMQRIGGNKQAPLQV